MRVVLTVTLLTVTLLIATLLTVTLLIATQPHTVHTHITHTHHTLHSTTSPHAHSAPKYKQSARSSAGAEKWLHVEVWEDPADCMAAARSLGYQVVATHLRENSIAIHEVDWTRPTAVVLGNEHGGVSDAVLQAADHCAIVPMHGFVESFNVSVAASLVCYEARQQRLQRLGTSGDLSPEEQEVLRAVYSLRTAGKTKLYVQALLDREPPHWQPKKMKQEWAARRAREQQEMDV